MSRRAWLCLLIPFGILATAGCGGGAPQAARYQREGAPAGGPDVAGEAAPAAKQAAPNAPPGGDAAAKAAPVDRKIIYTAKLDLVVKNLDEARKAVDDKLAAHAGRLVRSETRSDAGARRTATCTLEVPVEKFHGLVAALKEVGVPERDAVDSQDVTEEFVDVQARLKNLRQQEDKLNDLLKEKRKEEKLEDVIRVSDRIAEVRQQVERVEGRLKYLESRAAFSTVTLTLREVADYRPPTAPTFPDRVSRAFHDSWDALVSFVEGVALFAVAVSVWLPLLIPAGLVAVWLLRRLVRTVNAATTPGAPRRRVRPVEPPTDPPPAPPAG
jgi:hypothetical protein